MNIKFFLPNCSDKEYSFYYNLNENRDEGSIETLNNLFIVNTNNTYLKFDDAPYNFGKSILNKNQTITNSNKIHIKNNEYTFDFKITDRDKINSNNIIINYTVIIENDEAYSKQCQIKFNFEISSCGDNYIKQKNNCYKIINETIKSFYDHDKNNKESSCYQKFNLYIKEDSNECIELPEKVEGYYISNNITGLLSKCHENCLSCYNEKKTDDFENLIEPIKKEHYYLNCSEGYYFLECTTNCFDMNITQNGYYLDNFTLNDKGEIEPKFKKCYESCKTCIKYKEINNNKENHNCIECADNYYKL